MDRLCRPVQTGHPPLIQAMPRQLFSINTFRAKGRRLGASIKLSIMKRKVTMKKIFGVILCLGSCCFGGGMVMRAGDAMATNATSVRIGVYDSRAVTYAWFWTDTQQRQLKELTQSARAAKAAGETKRFQELSATLRRLQDEMHREVFSTAPADRALAAIKERIPEIEKSAGVAALVSKWDEPALRKYPDADRVDVTGQLVQEFKPTEKQLKVIADLQKQKPVPLEECNELIRQGKI
jgi:hypothetical protein